MALGKSTYLEAVVINWLRGTTAPAAPAAIYVALYAGNPDLGQAEVTGNNYSRKAITLSAPGGGNPSTTDNSAQILFDIASGSWGTISHGRIYDNSSGGNALVTFAFNTPVAVASGNQFVINAGDLDLSED
jgi:hypothetical protein